MTDVIDLAKRLAAGENLRGKCQRLVGLIGDTQMGARWSIPSYSNATAAYNAAKNAGLLISVDLNAVEVGWVAYFEYRDAANNGHDGIIVGPNLMVSMTTNRAGLVADLGNGLFLSTISGYATSRKLLGISKHNGARAQITGLTSPYSPKPRPDQRQVGALSARRRADYRDASSEYLSVPNFPARSIQTPSGWASGAVVSESSVWFVFPDGRAAHSSAFTDRGTHDLVDLTPKPEVETPTMPDPQTKPDVPDAPVDEPAVDEPAVDPDELDSKIAAALERLPQIEGVIEQTTVDGDNANPRAPLSGLFAGNDRARKTAYLIYASAALLISFGPDVVVSGVISGNVVPEFVAYIGLSSSILLKIGTALGFVAAANTSK